MDLGLHAWLGAASVPHVVACAVAFLSTLYLAAIALGFAIERSVPGRRNKIFDVPIRPGQFRWEVGGTLRFVAIVAPLLALTACFAIQTAPSTGGAFALTFVSCLFFFDLYYYGLHRTMHSKRFFRFHRYHHRSRVNTPLTSISTSGVEAVGWAVGFCLPVMLISLVTPVSVEGWAAYLVYNSVGNVAGHINAEMVPRIFARPPFSWFNHPISYHALHHARVTRHYCFGATATDIIAGTTWDDWQRVYARVSSGQPLRKLEERA